MGKIKRNIILAGILAVICLMMSACGGSGKHYCSYGGCTAEVEHEGDRCSRHKGLDNNPYYGWPEEMIPDDKKWMQWIG